MNHAGALILTYHHIADLESDAGVLSVSPRHFAEHLEVLRREARPIRLEEIAASAGRDLPARSVAITMDDGYADNLIAARPLLARHDVPATVFVTGVAGDDAPEFWWDELERILIWPGRLPETLELPVAGDRQSFYLGAGAVLTWEEFRRLRDWKVWYEPLSARQALFQDLCPKMKLMSRAEREKLICALRKSSVQAGEGVPCHRRMTPDEVARVREGGLMDVGAHTVTHCKLPLHSAREQRDEIRRNRSYLEEITGSPVHGFSYPYGDYAQETVDIVREEGFDYAVSIIAAGVQPESDRHLLPRHHICDQDGDEFAQWLHRTWGDAGNEG